MEQNGLSPLENSHSCDDPPNSESSQDNESGRRLPALRRGGWWRPSGLGKSAPDASRRVVEDGPSQECARRERTRGDRKRTANRLFGASMVVVLYVLVSPQFLVHLLGLAMASDSCYSDSKEAICSVAIQSLVVRLHLGGAAAGLLFVGIILFGAKIAPKVLWWTAFVLALVTPIVCTSIARNLAGW